MLIYVKMQWQQNFPLLFVKNKLKMICVRQSFRVRFNTPSHRLLNMENSFVSLIGVVHAIGMTLHHEKGRHGVCCSERRLVMFLFMLQLDLSTTCH